ncbi:MAG TPA: hypothetical protein DIV79_15830 [Opitutae bacterium]|nr:hypothetical protein [Opitutae bacterium]
MDRAYDDIKDRMDRVLPELPEEVEEIRVYTYDEDDEPILFSALTLGPNIDNPEYFIERYIEPALQRIDGVGDVDIKGDASREVRISLDQEKLKAHNIDVYELSRNLRDQNLNLSAGRVMEGGQEYMVRSVGRIEDISQLQDYIVDREKGVRLKDLGEVYISTLENYSTWRLNGGKSYGVEIMRSGNANIVEISKAVNRVFERFENSRRWDGIQFRVFKDQGKYILESMNNLKMSALWGGVFSFIVLICFLRSLRITLTITLAIPLSLLCSVTVLYFMGWTLNILTMMGLLISIGLVVDNAIVMVENIHSKREMGLGPKEGALQGASEISLAITMSTMTTMVVFLPLLLMESGGEIRFYFHRIGIPVVSALAASLTIALMVIPLASKIFFAEQSKRTKPKGGGGVSRIYQSILDRALKDRALATFILLAIIGGSLYPIFNDWIDTRDRSSSSGRISLRFELPAGIKKEEVAEWVDYVEAFIEDNRDRYEFDSYTSYFSYSSMYVYLNMAQETLNWQQVATRWFLEKIGRGPEESMSRGDIMRDIGERLELPPGLTMRYSYSSSGDSTRSFYLMLYGDDTETLYQLGEEVVRRISTINELVGLDLELEENNQELNVELDREQAQQMGISTRDVSNSISYAMRGSSVGRFYQDGRRDINIEARLQEEDRETLEALSRLTFMSNSGNEVPLQSISELDFRDAARYIRRDDRKTSMRIRALMETDDVRRTDAQIEALMEGFEMPRGYRWDRGSSYYRLDKENQEIRFALVMIFIFVLFLMGILFESFVLPLAVIGTVPIAGVGVVWMLVASDTAFERMASVGAMILIGIVVNNGIVLVDLSQRLMKEGLSRNQALLEASKRRFRPIWITSLTTIFGMVPIAIGGSKVMDMSYAPMGRVIIGGLLVSTFLTLIVVPLFYTFLDDLRNWFGRTASMLTQRNEPIAESQQKDVAEKA